MVKLNISEVRQASKSMTRTLHRSFEITRWSVNTLLSLEKCNFKTVILKILISMTLYMIITNYLSIPSHLYNVSIIDLVRLTCL